MYVYTSDLDSDFLSTYLAAPKHQRLIDKIQVGATRQALTKYMILNFDLPIPNMSEQKKIVDDVMKRFSVISVIEEYIEFNLKRAERLRQSILKRAFEGRLV